MSPSSGSATPTEKSALAKRSQWLGAAALLAASAAVFAALLARSRWRKRSKTTHERTGAEAILMQTRALSVEATEAELPHLARYSDEDTAKITRIQAGARGRLSRKRTSQLKADGAVQQSSEAATESREPCTQISLLADLSRCADAERSVTRSTHGIRRSSSLGQELFGLDHSNEDGVLSDPGDCKRGAGTASDSDDSDPSGDGSPSMATLKESLITGNRGPLSTQLDLKRFKCRSAAISMTSARESYGSTVSEKYSARGNGRRDLLLESEMAACDEELARLTCSLEHLRKPTSSVDEHLNRPSEFASGYEDWNSSCQALVGRLRALSGEALECGVKRDQHYGGAIDVFEQANHATERLAHLLDEGADAYVEASAPALCNAKEWRVVAEAVGETELQLLRELLAKVHDCDTHPACLSNGRMLSQSPATLLRFLRARDGNVALGEQMFRSSLHWRWTTLADQKHDRWVAEEQAAETWRAKLVRDLKVHKDLGVDRFGLPVYLFRWSVFDVAGAERELGAELTVQIMLSIHENIARAMASAVLEKQTFAPGCMQIWDIGNYGKHGGANWWSRMLALVRFLPKVASVMEQNYPEVVRKIIIVRSSTMTRYLYRTVTPFLPSNTLSKGHLFGWSPEQWLPEIRKEAPELTLPAFLCLNDDEAFAKAEPKGGIWAKGAASWEGSPYATSYA